MKKFTRKNGTKKIPKILRKSTILNPCPQVFNRGQKHDFIKIKREVPAHTRTLRNIHAYNRNDEKFSHL